MKCKVCGIGSAQEIKRPHQTRYNGEPVEVEITAFRCDQCGEEFLTPEQSRAYSRAVKNEVRKKYARLSPEKITQIREKLGLSQADLEELLGTGPKVVVRWESGKVIQENGHDTTLRLLERDPSLIKRLHEIRKAQKAEQESYLRTHQHAGAGAGAGV